jgi:predicted  nucleic acid-binding Zn-ribbon protein
MSAIEDTRKVMQDFLAPELRAISVRLDALEKRLDSVERRFDDIERRAEKRHDEMLSAIARMSDISDLRERLARLEAKDRPHQ